MNVVLTLYSSAFVFFITCLKVPWSPNLTARVSSHCWPTSNLDVFALWAPAPCPHLCIKSKLFVKSACLKQIFPTFKLWLFRTLSGKARVEHVFCSHYLIFFPCCLYATSPNLFPKKHLSHAVCLYSLVLAFPCEGGSFHSNVACLGNYFCSFYEGKKKNITLKTIII